MAFGLRRYQHEGHLHFLTFSGYRRLLYLNTLAAYARVEPWLETLRTGHGFEVHGYILMPEHVHLLLSQPRHHTHHSPPSEAAKFGKGHGFSRAVSPTRDSPSVLPE